MTWVTVAIFSAAMFFVFIAFEPTRQLLCSAYEPAGIGLLIGEFMGRATSCFGGVVYDYQTLITGALAVFAAWWTVSAMERADFAANRRHQEQLQATRYRDELIIARTRAEIRRCMGWAVTFCERLMSEGLEEIPPQRRAILYKNLIVFTKTLQNTLEGKVWMEAVPLLPPHAIAAAEDVQRACSQLIELAPPFEVRSEPSFSPSHEDVEILGTFAGPVLIQACESLDSELERWRVG